MPSAIVETATKGSAISAPVGADVRNAASVRVPFQAVGDRLAWLEAFVTRIAGALTDIITTGILSPPDDVEINLEAGFLDITGNDDYGLRIGTGAKFIPNGRIENHCFDGTGGYGRANKRVQGTIAPAGGSTTDVDATIHDMVWVNPAAACNIRIDGTPAIAYQPGDHITIQNSSIYTIDVKNPAGTTLVQLTVANNWATMILAEDGTTWKLGPSKTG